jgi:hypothetical protein
VRSSKSRADHPIVRGRLAHRGRNQIVGDVIVARGARLLHAGCRAVCSGRASDVRVAQNLQFRGKEFRPRGPEPEPTRADGQTSRAQGAL